MLPYSEDISNLLNPTIELSRDHLAPLLLCWIGLLIMGLFGQAFSLNELPTTPQRAPEKNTELHINIYF